MTTFDPAAADIWADLSEGAAHNPEKGEIRAWAGTVETAVQALEGDVADLQAAGTGVIEHLDPVAVATTANITLSGEQTLDTDVTTSASRVLVKNQTDASENGVYVSAAGAWARATDANTAAKVAQKAVLVEGGATHGGQVWGTYFEDTDTLDTTNMAWVKMRDDSGMQDQIDAKANTADLATVATSGSSDDLTEGSTNLLLTVAERASIAATSGLTDLTDTRGNLVVPDDPDYQAGYRISSSTGAMTAVSGYDTTGYIPVESGEAYVTNLSYAYIAYFDSDQNFVSSASATAVDLHATFTAPGDGYVRGSIGSTGGFDPDQIYLVKSAAVPDVVEPNGNLVVNDRISQLPAASIADGAVSPLKTEMWAVGKNKANPVGRVDGYYMSTAGAPISSASYCYWPAFAVEEGQVWTANQNMRFVTFYDVGGRAWSTVGVSTSVTQFTVPADAVSAVVTSTLSTASTFQVELAASSTAFEEFHYAGQDSLPSGEPLHWGVPDPDALVDALDTELGSTDWRDASAVPAFYGLDRLRETRQRLRMLKYGQTGEDAQLSLGLIGDSFTHDNGRYALKVARFLWRKYLPDDTNVEYGPTGFGWVGFRGAASGSLANGTIYWNAYMTGAGTWTDTGSGEYSPDICATESSTATDYIEMAASFTYSSDNPVFTLFAEGGAGEVRYRWTSAGAWTTIVLSSLSAGLQTITLTGAPTSGTGKLRFEVVSGTVKLYGMNMARAKEGVIVHKLGATGTQAAHWTAVDATEWQAGIAALGLDCAVILHGTNDQIGAGATKATFKTNITTLVDRVRTARPTADILLVAPMENQQGASPAMSEYAAAMYEIAKNDRDCAFLDLQSYFGEEPADYAFGSDRPWFASDGIHPDPNSGGWAMADAILGALGERSA